MLHWLDLLRLDLKALSELYQGSGPLEPWYSPLPDNPLPPPVERFRRQINSLLEAVEGKEDLRRLLVDICLQELDGLAAEKDDRSEEEKDLLALSELGWRGAEFLKEQLGPGRGFSTATIAPDTQAFVAPSNSLVQVGLTFSS